MKRVLALFFISTLLTGGVMAQSGRITPKDTPTDATIIQLNDLTPEQMFAEASVYAKTKFAEYEQKKIPYSTALHDRTVLEQRQLAAKYATVMSERRNLSGDDFYYLGMLNWYARNDDRAKENLYKFIPLERSPSEKAQTARSVIVIISAQTKDFDAAEKFLKEYLQNEPIKIAERGRMESELADAYRANNDLARAAVHAEESYRAAKALFKDWNSRARGISEVLGAATKAFQIYDDAGKQPEADKTLDDLRETGVLNQSNGIFYTAVDMKIKYLIETNRKPLAMQTYADALAQSVKDFSEKKVQDDLVKSLKKRLKHYQVLGETAPEIVDIDKWMPGNAQTLASLRGKVILLDFWATWCAPCIEAFPSLIAWHENYGKDGFVILGMTRYYGEVKAAKADFAAEFSYLDNFRKTHRLPYEIGVAKGQANQINYGAMSIPTTVLIDRKGVVRYVELGTSASRSEEIRKFIEKLLAEK